MRHPTSQEKFGRSEPGRCILNPETKSLIIMLDNEERTDTTSGGTRTVTWHKDTHVHFSALPLPLALRSSVLYFFLWLSLCLALYYYLFGSREALPVHPPSPHQGRRTTTRMLVMERFVNLERDHNDTCTLLVSLHPSAILWKE